MVQLHLLHARRSSTTVPSQSGGWHAIMQANRPSAFAGAPTHRREHAIHVPQQQHRLGGQPALAGDPLGHRLERVPHAGVAALPHQRVSLRAGREAGRPVLALGMPWPPPARSRRAGGHNRVRHPGAKSRRQGRTHNTHKPHTQRCTHSLTHLHAQVAVLDSHSGQLRMDRRGRACGGSQVEPPVARTSNQRWAQSQGAGQCSTAPLAEHTGPLL